MSNETFVVIGAGQAGGRAVEAMRTAGFAGRIALVGAETHLPYERPPLSKELLAGDDVPFQIMFDAAWFAARQIDLYLGRRAVEIDRTTGRVALNDGSALPYDRLLLATGGAVLTLPILGVSLPGVHTLRTIDESRAIAGLLAGGGRIVVVGGGFIGLEIAASARLRGCAVTVLEYADRLMGRALPAEIGTIFAELYREKGVDLRLSTGIAAIEGNDRAERVVTSAGETIAADGVVIGVGIAPDTALATAAGLTVDNGIVVDEFCRTSDPAIYAAGDVTRHFNPLLGRHVRLESWQNAQNQGIAAAQNMCGQETPFAEVPWFWSDQFDVNLQVCGAPERWEDLIMRGDIAARDGILFRREGETVTGAIGLNRARDMRMVKRLMTAGKTPTAEQLADDTVGFRDLLR
jgi:3-phenylpropionate/trans-cinnamate dioxygenase ferredoxin reductase subunit